MTSVSKNPNNSIIQYLLHLLAVNRAHRFHQSQQISEDLKARKDRYTQPKNQTSTQASPVQIECILWVPHNTLCNSYPDTYQECLIFRSIFEKLYFENIGNFPTQVNSQQCIHITVVTQFFLDCFISTQCLLNLLLSAINSKQWVDLRLFMQSFENIQKVVYEPAGFFFRAPDEETKRRTTIQMLLCSLYLVFFLVGVHAHNSKLDSEKLSTVFSMAFKRNKTPIDKREQHVRAVLERVSGHARTNKTEISFEEFSRIFIVYS